MTTTQVVETSVTVNNNSPIQDYVHRYDQTQPTLEMTPVFKPYRQQGLLDFAVRQFNNCVYCKDFGSEHFQVPT